MESKEINKKTIARIKIKKTFTGDTMSEVLESIETFKDNNYENVKVLNKYDVSTPFSYPALEVEFNFTIDGDWFEGNLDISGYDEPTSNDFTIMSAGSYFK